MRWCLAMGLLLGLLMPISAFPCDMHPLPAHNRGLIMVAPLGSSGLYGFWYDLDQDDIIDFALIFQMDQDGMYFTWPLFYFKYIDLFGAAEEVWIDRGGVGECYDIRLYYKRSVQQ